MRDGVWPLVTAAEMRALDRYTIETLGVPGELLMECAGRAVAAEVLARRALDAPVLVVCGTGNNGGDGMVVARHLHLLGVPVRLALVGEAARLQGDAAANWARAKARGVPLAPEHWQPDRGGVVVDALFGTGLSRAVEGEAKDAIERMRRRDGAAAIVSVDLPSGLDADTGQPHGASVEADCTVTLGLPKRGLALEPGRSLAGRVLVARIGIADEAPGIALGAEVWTRAAAGARLPARPEHGHKGSFGHLLLVAGSTGKSGAAALAAHGAARGGAGLVTIACPESLNPVLETKCTEAMTAPLAEGAAGALGLAAEKAVLELAESRDAVVLGPGLGRAEETLELARRVVGAIERPLVLDADGLIAFAGDPGALARRKAPTIVTPHPGEAAALLGTTPREINADRIAAARELAAQTRATVVLKGAATVIASEERVVVNPTGGPILATGGTGDVLAGLVGAALAQGLPAPVAGALCAYVHGAAADRLAQNRGSSGALAGEVSALVPAVVDELRRAAATACRVSDVLAFPEP